MAEAIARDVVSTTGCSEAAVSVGIEEVAPEEWAETVYRPEIMEYPDQLYKKPGYNPFESAEKKVD